MMGSQNSKKPSESAAKWSEGDSVVESLLKDNLGFDTLKDLTRGTWVA